MKALVFDRFGEPAEVLQLRDMPIPEPGPGEVRVRMLASPINPSDLLTVRGVYGRLPKLPATPGFEGVGLVEAAGSGWLQWLRGLKPGRRVAVLNGGGGNWAEQVVVPARQLVPVPEGLSDDQAATFFVNPATALIMTRWVLDVPAAAWLVQSAAGSALGRMVIRLGKKHGFRTINVVRRGAQAEELLKLGGDAAIVSTEESVAERVLQLTGGKGAAFGLDAVGGATAVELAKSLAPHGRLLLYGTLAMEPMTLESRVLMGGQKQIEGFWLSEWVKEQRILTMLKLFRQVTKLLQSGVLGTEIGTTFPLEKIAEAVRLAERPGRQGKVLLRIAP